MGRTNLETIRACSPEELAFYIEKKFEACPGNKKYTRGVCDPTAKKCQACWLGWLLGPENDEEWDQWNEQEDEE